LDRHRGNGLEGAQSWGWARRGLSRSGGAWLGEARLGIDWRGMVGKAQ
jgi:hypothetical protein